METSDAVESEASPRQEEPPAKNEEQGREVGGADGDYSSEVKEIATSYPGSHTPGDAGDTASAETASAAVATEAEAVDAAFAPDVVPVAELSPADSESEQQTEVPAVPSPDVCQSHGVAAEDVTLRTKFDAHDHTASIRVLKPPGGGTSDIFGAPEAVQNSPRRARNNLQSSVFGPPINGEVTTPRSKSGTNSYNRLFGPAETRPQSATKNRLKSNIILSVDGSTKDNNSNSPSKDTSTSSVDAPMSNKDGNPVTGEGYTNGEKQPSGNGGQSTAPTTNGTSHSAPPQRARVPPGGFSSGLW